ncbi:hypothetical protein OPQ81_009710 [Rhizoctonia solani]|nr:hypothetical protein OPQ81_009710 [Rhizoctonia solani]
MDRSNSTASTSSAASSISRASSKASTTGLTSYQERLLERTSSLNRTGTQNAQNRTIFASPTGVPPPSRRWAPSHRVSASVDTVRARWESRGEEQHEGETTPIQSPTRPMSSAVEDMIRRNTSNRSTTADPPRIPGHHAEPHPPTSDDPQTPNQRPPSRTVEDILRRHDLLTDNTPDSPSRAHARLAEASSTPTPSSDAASQAASVISRSRATPSFLKRRTLPDPIAVSSYLPEEGQPAAPPPAASPPVSSTPAQTSPTRSHQLRSP